MTASINASTSSGVVVTSDTSGSLDIQSNGSTKFSVTSSGVSYTPAGSAITSGTAQASTSGTSIDFTGIPSWVKRITVMFTGVSTNGSSNIIIQIGTSGSPTTSGYLSVGFGSIGVGVGSTVFTAGFGLRDANSAGYVMSGNASITNLTSNTWSFGATMGVTGGSGIAVGGGSLALGGTLNMVRITTVNGTDTFDAGSINILYE